MATKFVSALTGPEMDSALIDMAYHNSEAYAVGTRNGVEVGSSDVTYHNNSKYYAEQVYGYTDRAEDAAARAEAAVPAGTAGAVFFDRAQSLTTAQQSQARANIMAGGSNRNLLDNAYFVGGGSQLGDGVFPINQRGQTSYGGDENTNIDRWWKQYDTVTTLTSAGMRMTGKWDVDQRLPQVLPSGTYTFSVNVVSLGSTGAILQFLDENYQQLASAPLNNEGITSYTLTSARIRGVGVNMAKPDGSGDITFASMKLEAGTVSTLANDVPPDFGEELRKCMRYFVRYKNDPVGYGYISSDKTNVYLHCPTGIQMRAVPTVALNGSLQARAYNQTIAIQSVYLYDQPQTEGVTLRLGLASQATAMGPASVYFNSSGQYIDFSADL